MRTRFFLICVLCAALTAMVSAHDLYLKFDSYFLQPNSKALVRLLNGSFHASENPVARDRMVDVSIINAAGGRANPSTADWRDEGKSALLNLQTGEAGTYVAGVSTKPREFALKAAQFNHYLSHDGVPDILAKRKKNNELTKDIHERYSKHVKAIFQVGDARTDAFKTPFGYPVEIIPQQNPYGLKVGETLEVFCVKDGQPLTGQFVMAGRELKGRKIPASSMRTDANGIARVPLKGAGKWYVKFIQMTPLSEPQVNYESKWATLTFEVK
jgi:uncharacterized GH25 family protein